MEHGCEQRKWCALRLNPLHFRPLFNITFPTKNILTIDFFLLLKNLAKNEFSKKTNSFDEERNLFILFTLEMFGWWRNSIEIFNWISLLLRLWNGKNDTFDTYRALLITQYISLNRVKIMLKPPRLTRCFCIKPIWKSTTEKRNPKNVFKRNKHLIEILDDWTDWCDCYCNNISEM